MIFPFRSATAPLLAVAAVLAALECRSGGGQPFAEQGGGGAGHTSGDRGRRPAEQVVDDIVGALKQVAA